MTRKEIRAELAVREVASIGITRATRPRELPGLARRPAARGQASSSTSTRTLFDDRRRSKTEAQIAGMRRAQKAAEAAMDTCRDMLRRSEISGDELLLDGELLTVERVKAAMNQTFAAHDTTAEEYIVAPGRAGSRRPRHGLRPDPAAHAARRRHLPARQRLRPSTPT